MLGFGPEELAALLGTGGHTGITDPDAVDLWALGRHRLLCGDATSAEDTQKVPGGVSPHLMVTDPPSGVDYDPDWRNRANRANGKP